MAQTGGEMNVKVEGTFLKLPHDMALALFLSTSQSEPTHRLTSGEHVYGNLLRLTKLFDLCRIHNRR